MIMETKENGNDTCKKEGGWYLMAKIFGVILAILLTLFMGITALGYFWPTIQEYRYEMEAERFVKEINAEKARLEALEKADTFGGATPEATFDMFLAALKNEDIELASKYYDVSVQEEALAGLKLELEEDGNLDLSIKYFTDVRGGEKKCNELLDGCVFEYEVENGFKSISLNKKNYNNLWKITQPY